MRRTFLLLISLFMALACARESGLRFEISEGLLAFLPQFNDSLLYTDGTDSLYLRLESNTSTNPRLGGTVDLGNLGEADYLELEELQQFYSLDSLFWLEYHFANQYTAQAAYPISDNLQIKLLDNRAGTETLLGLTTADSLRCILNCTFADTLTLDSNTTYYNVYFSDSTQQRIIYINQVKGLAAFKVNDQLFKRIN